MVSQPWGRSWSVDNSMGVYVVGKMISQRRRRGRGYGVSIADAEVGMWFLSGGGRGPVTMTR